MAHIGILGTGDVGQAIAHDLASSHSLTAIDINSTALQDLKKTTPSISTIKADLNKQKKEFPTLLKDCDLVINAVPGSIGFPLLQSVIKANKDVIDISFFAENPFSLQSMALERGVSAIIDAGIAPGLNNLILGHHYRKNDLHSFRTYVGGLPVHPKGPFQYKAPFSPTDVIEEYLRKVRLIKDGNITTYPALSEPEQIELPNIGTLEAFNTDGLRTLIDTFPLSYMQEKTLRYPGHRQLIQSLKKSGFFDQKSITANGKSFSAKAATTEILKKEWELGEAEKEFTVMQVELLTKTNERIVYYIYDEYDSSTNITSMARTTGYTCCALVQLFTKGALPQKGVIPPEYIGLQEEALSFVFNYLQERGIHIEKNSNREE